MRTILSIEKNSTSYEEFKKIITESGIPISEVISGGLKNDNAFGHRWAVEHNIPISVFRVNRNESMVTNAEAMIGMWKNIDGEMKDLLSRANKHSLKIFITKV